ncbi:MULTISPECIES: hypothetical protein [unclassified Undibacterium]|nr:MULTISPECIES: hypothetical protein [unclassified Undibacterium]MEB0230461.1 hypothetical protein [Undibacterium sp. 10I3]MEB0258477.1 hypothetical protein [Undibacterium sp. 5I1]
MNKNSDGQSLLFFNTLPTTTDIQAGIESQLKVYDATIDRD